ncbi:MAG: hypothetical protein KTR21_12755 [Rhodobacteraceae bacterium]|nr:hypothetical protein [Paracoccaceae bacterium]
MIGEYEGIAAVFALVLAAVSAALPVSGWRGRLAHGLFTLVVVVVVAMIAREVARNESRASASIEGPAAGEPLYRAAPSEAMAPPSEDEAAPLPDPIRAPETAPLPSRSG